MEMARTIKQTIKEIVTTNNTPVASEETQDSDSSSNMSNELIEAANQPSMKVPVCYPIIQIEVLQTLGISTFASQYEANEFLQRIINLVKKPDTTKISRLPTPSNETTRFPMGNQRRGRRTRKPPTDNW